jgi:hypothetical protein
MLVVTTVAESISRIATRAWCPLCAQEFGICQFPRPSRNAVGGLAQRRGRTVAEPRQNRRRTNAEPWASPIPKAVTGTVHDQSLTDIHLVLHALRSARRQHPA